MRIFREQVSECIERPKIKLGTALIFVLIIAGSFVGAVFAKNAAKDNFCLTHNCTNPEADTSGDQIALGVGIGVMLFGAAIVAAMSLLIVCCFSETTRSYDDDTQSALAGSDSSFSM